MDLSEEKWIQELVWIISWKTRTTQPSLQPVIIKMKYFQISLGLRLEKSDKSYLNRFFLRFIKKENTQVYAMVNVTGQKQI